MSGYVRIGHPNTEKQKRYLEEKALKKIHDLELMAREEVLLEDLCVSTGYHQEGKEVFVEDLMLSKAGYYLRSYYVKPTFSMRLHWSLEGRILINYRSLEKRRVKEKMICGPELTEVVRKHRIHPNSLSNITEMLTSPE